MRGIYDRNYDSIDSLQMEINKVGAMNYAKSKKKKYKDAKEKDRISNQNSIDNHYRSHLPSIHQNVSKKKLASLHNDQHSELVQKIREFENRMNILVVENAVNKRHNEKLIEHVAMLKQQKILAEKQIKREPQVIYQHMPTPTPQPFPFPNFMPMPMSQMMFPGANGGMMNPFQNYFGMPMQNQNPNEGQNKNQSIKKKGIAKLNNPLSRFRVLGWSVFFSIFYPKYCRTFTLNRFDMFKENWVNNKNLSAAQKSLSAYFREHLVFDESDISDMNEIKKAMSKKNSMKKSSKKKGVKQSTNKMDSTKKKKSTRFKNNSDDEGSSDQISSGNSSDLQSEIHKNKPSQENQSEDQSDNVMELYLRMENAINFVMKLIKNICEIIKRPDFQEKNPYLTLLLPRQFQPDGLHEEFDGLYLNLHKEKGYNQYSIAVCEYLLIKNIFLFIFIDESLLSECAKEQYKNTKKSITSDTDSQLLFSLFVRTVIFKLILEDYADAKLQTIKETELPKKQLVPFFRISKPESPLNNILWYDNDGISMKQSTINELSQDDRKKNDKLITTGLNEICQVLVKKLKILRAKNEYSVIKQKTLSSKYRTEGNQYFHLHKAGSHSSIISQQHSKSSLNNSKVIVSDARVMSISDFSSEASDNISIANRIKNNNNAKSRNSNPGTSLLSTQKASTIISGDSNSNSKLKKPASKKKTEPKKPTNPKNMQKKPINEDDLEDQLSD